MIGPLIKISPIISLVDEFTFYAYHKSIYDRGFRFIVKLCSEWTENKWVPSFLDGFAHWLGNVTAAVSRTAIDG
jgi:hypothetical protein